MILRRLFDINFFFHQRGKGDYFRLGHGSDDHVRRPKIVEALEGKRVISVACGSLHCVVCTDKGEVYTWGDNDEGQLGDGTTNAVQRPKLVQSFMVSVSLSFISSDVYLYYQFTLENQS